MIIAFIIYHITQYLFSYNFRKLKLKKLIKKIPVCGDGGDGGDGVMTAVVACHRRYCGDAFIVTAYLSERHILKQYQSPYNVVVSEN